MVMEIGDIPGGSLYGGTISHASLASNGASAAYGSGIEAWRAPQPVRIIGAAWVPTGANETASTSASYRRLTLYNASTDESGTVVLASLNLSASLASLNSRALSLGTTPTLAIGEIVKASQTTVGGDHSNGTVVQAGYFVFNYRPI